MLQGYEDIIAIAREARRPIGWWDENGVPRFMPHHPRLCPDIYSDEVILLKISCQACGCEFDVQMSSRTYPRATNLGALVAKKIAPHYGDPPSHNCATGETMNCWDLHVLEFWRRPRGKVHDWERVPELEIALPDATDEER